MKFTIEISQKEEKIFASVISEEKEWCVGESKTPWLAVKDACEKLAGIMQKCEDTENEEILKMVEERDTNDSGIRYTHEDVIQMRREKRNK